MIDNYDSFTYNLVQYFQQMGLQVEVIRNDAQTVDQVIARNPALIVLSPGPSDPEHAGICLDLVRRAAEVRLPLLGICLGHQTIGQAFGGAVVKHAAPMHGKTSAIRHFGEGLFAGLPSPLTATRYHSLIVSKDRLPDCLMITAESEDGVIQGLRHKSLPIEGVQFHPESVLTQFGHRMLANFVEAYCR
jgi:anthranilate synthase component 2